VLVSNQDIVVQGRKVSSVSEAMKADSDLIAPLKAELDYHAGERLIRKEKEARTRPSRSWGTRRFRTGCCARYGDLRRAPTTANISFAVIQKGKT